MRGVTAVEIVAAAPNAAVTASVQFRINGRYGTFDEKYVNCGECTVNPSVSHTDFSIYTIPAEYPEEADPRAIRINLGGIMNIYSLQVIKG
jgi:hypothetical protein